jgi:lysophospholipase L1-like esterase
MLALLSLFLTADATTVFVLAGQSNMVGHLQPTFVLEPPYDAPQPDVRIWDAGWAPLAPGYGDDWGPELSFGRAIADAMPDEDVRLVKAAFRGTALYDDWAPATGGSYLALASTVSAALADLDATGTPYTLGGVVWMQGESDAHEGRGADYEANLRAFVADLRGQLGDPELPFVIGRISPFFGTDADNAAVRTAQITVARDTPNARWVDTDALPLVNFGHYDSDGTLSLGRAFAWAWLRLVRGPIRVLPLGDSITEGAEGTPGRGGYKAPLFERLNPDPTQPDYVLVGTRPHQGDHASQIAHEGYGGYTIDQIADGVDAGGWGVDVPIEDRLDATRPHVVLLNAGTNDLGYRRDVAPVFEAPDRLDALVQRIRQHTPQATVVLSSLTPTVTDDAMTAWFGRRVAEQARARVEAGEPVRFADMHARVPARLVGGVAGNHPTQAGYDRMAEVWSEALVPEAEPSLRPAPGPRVWPVAASAVSHAVGHEPAHAIDGSGLQGALHDRVAEGAAWLTDLFQADLTVPAGAYVRPAQPQWFALDLGVPHDLDRVAIYNGTYADFGGSGLAAAQIRTVEVWSAGDDGVWQRLGEARLRAHASGFAWHPGEAFDVDLRGVRHLGFRIVETWEHVPADWGWTGGAWNTAGLSEVVVFGTPTP